MKIENHVLPPATWHIENAVPAPPHGNYGRYPFKDMKVGESVFFPGMTTRDTPRSGAVKVGLRHNMKFVSRTVDGGLRIWRVA